MWGVTLDGGHVPRSLRRDRSWFVVETSDGNGVEYWHYQGLTLRERLPRREPESQVVVMRPDHPRSPFVVKRSDEIIGLEVGGQFGAAVTRHADGVQVFATHVEQGKDVAQLVLAGAREATVRISDNLLVVADDRGRVIVVDLLRRSVRHDLRTR